MGSIKISACIITYNQISYIKECLEGAVSQNIDFDYEIVIGDDCSTDGTSQICAEYATKYPKLIRYFPRDENLGMTGNWKKSIENCQGEYIALCEGDDYWTDVNKLQKQVDFLDNNPDYVGCFHNVIVKNETVANIEDKPWRIYHKDIFTLLDTFSKTALFHTCSFVFRNNDIDIPPWFQKVKSADMSLFAIVASKGNLKLLPGNMSVYRKNDRGITSSLKIVEYHEGRVELMNYFKAFFGETYDMYLDDLINYHSDEIVKAKKGKFKNILKKINLKLR